MSQYDVTVEPFKAWLINRRKQAKRDAIDELGRRLVDDKRLPARGSLGLYRAHLRAKGYSVADMQTFERAWQEMRAAE